MILGIIGTAGTVAIAFLGFYIFYLNRPRLKLEGKRAYHWTWFDPIDKKYLTAIRVVARLHNRGPVGTRLTKAELEFVADTYYRALHPYAIERIEPSDSYLIDIEFLQSGISIKDAKIHCKVLVYHTFGMVPFEVDSDFSEQPVGGIISV